MQTTRIHSKTKITTLATAVALLGLGAIQTQAQSVLFNFSDGTSDGWSAGGFSDSTALGVVNIGGNNYIQAPIGGFQVANVATGNTSSALFLAMAAAAQNPSGYVLSYDWYVNTATFTGATINSYLQAGSFVNDGGGDYSQDFGSVKEVQLSGAQLTSGNVFQGAVSVNMGAAGLLLPTPGQTYYRLGLVENGDSGVPYVVDFTDISVAPITAVPEPASFGLCGLLLAGGTALLRRRKA
jgi:hypothetical protein